MWYNAWLEIECVNVNILACVWGGELSRWFTERLEKRPPKAKLYVKIAPTAAPTAVRGFSCMDASLLSN